MILGADIREAFDIQPGTLLMVTPHLDRQEIVIKPTKTDDPIAVGRGMLAGGPSLTEALIEERKKDKILEDKKYARIFRS